MRRLSHRRVERTRERAFVIEGPTLVAAALDAGLQPEAVFVVDRDNGGDGTDDARREIVHAAAGRRIPVHQVSATTLARALDTTTPQGIAAIAACCDVPLPVALAADPVVNADAGAADLMLVLAGVADPGNAGTLVRTAEAAGAGAVVFCTGSVDPFAPKVVRAAAGSLFHVAIVHGGDPVQVLEQVGASGRRRLGTSAGSGDDYDRVELIGRVALVLGSEAHGLPTELTAAIDQWVRIPMAGRTESLNVAMAGSVLCFERARQQRARAGARQP